MWTIWIIDKRIDGPWITGPIKTKSEAVKTTLLIALHRSGKQYAVKYENAK